MRLERETKLSAEQAAAAGCDPGAGHVLVLARPGSGKTHTLSARARHLLREGCAPERLLAMTFSRRAADELQDRLPEGRIRAGTFHAVCADILEHHGAAIGIRWPFRIIDEVRGREILLRAVENAGLPLPREERWRHGRLAEIASRIARRKRLGRDRHEPEPDSELPAELVQRIDDCYGRLLREANALDFADLLVEAVRLLNDDEPTAELLRSRVGYLLVDEFHDISPEQYRLIQLLAPPRGGSHVFAVGDPDQAIYAWRGADAASHFGRFRSECRPREYHLTVNYRSLPPIIDAADQCLGESGRTRRSVPHREGWVRPVWCGLPDPQSEARQIVSLIRAALASGSVAGFGSFAVLYRSHKVGDILEAELLQAGGKSSDRPE